MTFYIKPPSGATNLENLERYTLKRMRFLLLVNECELEGTNEITKIDTLQSFQHPGSFDPRTQKWQQDFQEGSSKEWQLNIQVENRKRGQDFQEVRSSKWQQEKNVQGNLKEQDNEKLQKSLDRFQVLLRKKENVTYSDCLIEGSWKDRISHFTLRLACSMDQELQHFFMTAEKKLFSYRFSSMNADELAVFLKSTHKFLSRLLKRSRRALSEEKLSSLQSLHDILQKIYSIGKSWEDVAQKYVDGYSGRAVKVPFQCALDLIAHRNVELAGGMASIPISKLDSIMSGLFEKVLWHGMLQSHRALDHVLADERIEDLFDKVFGMFSTIRTNLSCSLSSGKNKCGMSVQNVDTNSDVFPLCMSHLHHTLRRKHRLRHFSRIQYTLFLKDAGLSVNDAINFWKTEYSQHERGKAEERRSISHSWTREAKRYTYSIRHLYGLEGSRIDYRSHSCSSIQKMNLGHGEEGGCPYKHFDKWSLATALTRDEIHPKAAADVLLSAQKQCYAEACMKHRLGKCAKVLTDASIPSYVFGIKPDENLVDCSPSSKNENKFKKQNMCSQTNNTIVDEQLPVNNEKYPMDSSNQDERFYQGGSKRFEKTTHICCKNELLPKTESALSHDKELQTLKDISLQFEKPVEKPTDYYLSFQSLLGALQHLEK